MNNNVISNLPLNRLYKFDEYYYVWNIKLHSTRGGKYPAKEYMPITEVYEIYNNMITCVASGRLINNNYSMEENFFSIFDYDQDDTYTFKITRPPKEAGATELRLLRDNISLVYNKNNKHSR